MLKYFILTINLLALATFANEYFFLNQENGTNYYIKSVNPFEVTNRIARLQNSTELTETNITAIAKPNWVILAEGLYKKNLTDIGYDGAWTNTSLTFEDIGLDLLLKMDQTNDLELAEYSTRKKSILESLYGNLQTYAKTYGIVDMRLYPYSSTNILETVDVKTYIDFNGTKFYRSEP
jgi:hypothetical protein